LFKGTFVASTFAFLFGRDDRRPCSRRPTIAARIAQASDENRRGRLAIWWRGADDGERSFWFSLSEDSHMKVSARNMLKGKVKTVNHGAVNSEVIVELPGGQQIVSVITKESATNLQLQGGKEVYVIVKATSVMLGVD